MAKSRKPPRQASPPENNNDDDDNNSSTDASQEPREGHTFNALCKAYRHKSIEKALMDSKLPVPPRHTIAKTLYMLGVPRERLQFVILWMCDRVFFAGQKCVKCGHSISKTHLESCVVQSELPVARPGKGIDTLLHKAITEFDAPSALLAFKILTKEVVKAYPPRSEL